MPFASLLQMTANVHVWTEILDQTVQGYRRTDVLNHVSLRPDSVVFGNDQQIQHDRRDALAQAPLIGAISVPFIGSVFDSRTKTARIGVAGKGRDTEKRFAHRIQVAARISKGHRDQMTPRVATKNA